MLDKKLLGGILLIVGTSLGGGMLALPVATAGAGFISSSLMIVLCWLAMTLAALFILEVNLWLPAGSNLISMAEITLGTPGKVTAWLSYLLLLYTLLAAYISGGGDLIHFLISQLNFDLPQHITTTLFVLCFSLIVYCGIQAVDQTNRLLMLCKLAIYCLLIVLIAPHIQPAFLLGGDYHYISASLMVLLTSFGFAIIVPSLRAYFDSNVLKLRQAIIIGSLFPLCCYLAWNAVIMGAIPRVGDNSLMALLHAPNASSGLGSALELAINNRYITELFRIFSTVCLLTAFLGVSLCLFDFLADGLHWQKKGLSGVFLNLLVFIPPLLIELYHPGIYIQAFSYAGITCAILLLLLPALMAYRGRYQLGLAPVGAYQVAGNKASLWFVMSLAAMLLSLSIWQSIFSLLAQ